MSESEVIRRLKEHIRACIIKHGRISKTDKGYIIKYIMDFLPWLSKEDAVRFFREKLFPVTVQSDDLGVKYDVYIEGVIVDAGEYGKLLIDKDKMLKFIGDLKMVGGVI